MLLLSLEASSQAKMSIAAMKPLGRHLSFAAALISATPQCVFFHSKLAPLSLRSTPKIGPILMGGKTYPGGLSKPVWRRTQSRKRKKLKRDGLALERQIYERRKRAELKSAVAVLELPLESVDKAAKLFPKSDEEQLKVLADRFQKADGIESGNPLPSSRFKLNSKQANQSGEDFVQEFYNNDEEFWEDYNSGRRMESRSGRFHHLMKGLLPGDASDGELELKVLPKSGGTELSRTSNQPSSKFHPRLENKSVDPVHFVQDDDDEDEFEEDIILSSRTESRSGKLNYLMKGLLFDVESDDEVDTEEDNYDVYEWSGRNSIRTMREKVNTLGLKKMNQD